MTEHGQSGSVCACVCYWLCRWILVSFRLVHVKVFANFIIFYMCIHSLLPLAARDVLKALFSTLNTTTALINPSIDFSAKYIWMLLYTKKNISNIFVSFWNWLHGYIWNEKSKNKRNQYKTKLDVSPIKTNFDIRLCTIYIIWFAFHSAHTFAAFRSWSVISVCRRG